MKPNTKSNGRSGRVLHAHQLQVHEDLHTPPPPYRDASSREIKRDIRQTRSALDETIDALTARLQPRRLAHEAVERLFDRYIDGRGSQVSHATSVKAQELASSAGDSLKHAGSVARRQGKRLGHNLAETIKDNPIGAALVGAGLAWMIFGGKDHDDDEFVELDDGRIVRRVEVVRRPVSVTPGRPAPSAATQEYEFGAPGNRNTIPVGRPVTINTPESVASRGGSSATYAGPGVPGSSSGDGRLKSAASSVKGAASSVGSSVKSGARSVGHGVSSVGSGLKSGASSVGSGIKSGAQSVGHGLSHSANVISDNSRRAARRTARMTRRGISSKPLLMAAGAVALGAIAGMLIPNTRREHEALGPVRDSALGSARGLANQGKQAALETLDRASDELFRENLNPGNLANELESMAREVANSAKQALEKRNLGDRVKRAAQATADHAKSQARSLKHSAEQEIDQEVRATNRVSSSSASSKLEGPGSTGSSRNLPVERRTPLPASTSSTSSSSSSPVTPGQTSPSSGRSGSSLSSSPSFGTRDSNQRLSSLSSSSGDSSVRSSNLSSNRGNMSSNRGSMSSNRGNMSGGRDLSFGNVPSPSTSESKSNPSSRAPQSEPSTSSKRQTSSTSPSNPRSLSSPSGDQSRTPDTRSEKTPRDPFGRDRRFPRGRD